MKTPFSYRNHFFSSFLLTSFLGHAFFLGAGSFLFEFSPRFGVQQAPSSMEVVLVKQPEPRVKKHQTEKILTTPKTPLEKAVVREKEEERVTPENTKSVMIPEAKGAVEQNKDPFLKNPPPAYPEYAREQGWEGVAVVKVLVGRNGLPNQVMLQKSSGYKILDNAALKAIRAWQFRPAGTGNFLFDSWIKIPVRFTLTEGMEFLELRRINHE